MLAIGAAWRGGTFKAYKSATLPHTQTGIAARADVPAAAEFEANAAMVVCISRKYEG